MSIFWFWIRSVIPILAAASKATPLAPSLNSGEHGKRKARKDLGVSMMMYGHVYVAQISLGAQLKPDGESLSKEAEARHRPSPIIAYSPVRNMYYDSPGAKP